MAKQIKHLLIYYSTRLGLCMIGLIPSLLSDKAGRALGLLAFLFARREREIASGQLAMELGVSIPTVSRCIGALRERGYQIQAVHRTDGWAYTLIPNGKNGKT